MTEQTNNTDVIIVGGGPVGLGLAIDLAQKGVTSLVLERTTSLHRIPKGQNLTQRTGEHFRAWGIGKAVREASPVPPEFGNAGIIIYGNLLGEYSYDWFQRSAVREYYFADNERLPQYNLEAVIQERVKDFPEIKFIKGAKVTDLAQDENGVYATFKCEGEEQTARGTYLAGCDGARSIVRELSGIKSDVDHEGPRMALLVFRSMELHNLLERYPGKSIFNVMRPELKGYWQFLGRVDLEGGWFYHAPVPPGTTKDNFDFKTYLHELAGTEFEMEFEHIGFWDLRISRAQNYRSGRVFIAGDSAHSHPPYGGYGVNNGFEDARNLSWKLAAVITGWAGKDLLDSYSAERHPVFQSVSEDFIHRMIKDFDGFLSTYSPKKDKAEFEDAWNQRANADDSDVTQYLPNYGGSPIVFGREGDTTNAKGLHQYKAEAGYHLAPQSLPDGSDLWDSLGDGFTLLNLIGDAALTSAFTQAADGHGVPLSVLCYNSPDLVAAYQAEAILVRPDQFIAWTGHRSDADANRILSRAIGA